MKRIISYMFVLAGLVCAQNERRGTRIDSSTVFPLDEVMITATRASKNVDAIGRSVDVVGSDDANNVPYQNVGEVLSLQPGMFVVGAGQNPGMNQTLFMRGAASHHTAVMVDGVRLTDPSTVNNVVDFSELSFLASDQLEIVRGTHSTLFGSSAIGGVVNILTGKGSEPGIHVDASGTTGVFGGGTFLHAEQLLVKYSDRSGLYLLGGIENHAVKGLDATRDTVSTTPVFKNRDRDDFDKRDYSGKIGYSDGAVDLYFSYKGNSQQSDIDRSAFVDDDNYTLHFDRNFFTYGASAKIFSSTELKYIGGYSNLRRNAVNDSSLVDALGTTDHTYFTDEYSGTSATNELQVNFLSDHIEGVGGIGQYDETMSVHSYLFSWSAFGIYESKTNLDTLDIRSTLRNAFLRFDIDGSIVDEALHDVTIGLGARLNTHNAYGENVTYEINPSYKISDGGLLYALHSTGFNAPSLYQLFAPNKYYASVVTRGNKNLAPEKSSTYEIGMKLSLTEKFRFSAAFFTTKISNSIEYVYLWDGTIGIDTLGNDWMRDDYRGDTYLNIGEATTSGFEVIFQAVLSDQISISGNFNYVTGELSYRPGDVNRLHTANHHVQLFNNGAFLNKDVTSSTLIRRPMTANIAVMYHPSANLGVRLDCRMVGERQDVYYDSKLGPYGALGSVPVKRYVLFDFSPTWKIDDHFSAAGRIENILDTEYSDINGFSTRGRSFYLKLHYEV